MSKLITLSMAVLLLSACETRPEEDSTSPPPFTYHGAGSYDPSAGEASFPGSQPLPDEQTPWVHVSDRSKYCTIYVDPETDEAVRSTFLQKLTGVWGRELVGSPLDLKPFGAVFVFRPSSSSGGNATFSGAFLQDEESINYDRICLSQPVTQGTYTGFRIVELKIANNEKATVFGATLTSPAPGRSNPVLLLTAPRDFDWNTDNSIRNLSGVFLSDNENETSVRIWAYPVWGP